MKNPQAEIAKTDAQTIFVLNGIKLLPDYETPGLYVQPGHTNKRPLKAFSAAELFALGAVKSTHRLWARAPLETLKTLLAA